SSAYAPFLSVCMSISWTSTESLLEQAEASGDDPVHLLYSRLIIYLLYDRNMIWGYRLKKKFSSAYKR
ncbi:MAG: hypothetical protein ACUVQ8_08545, partial [Nitrososphaeria archaeon]